MLVMVAVPLSGLAACEASGTATPTTTTSPEPLEWRPVQLPEGADPVTLTAAGADALLIGAYASTRPHPRLLVLQNGMLTQVPVEPQRESPYAPLARWLSIAVSGDAVEAVGGARGGAHANYRWTVWSGTWSGGQPRLVELPQPFGVFGGWGAGDLTGVAFAGSEPVIAGAWQSESTGNDVSLWKRSGSRWGRLSSTGSALASTPQALNGARSITTTGGGLALAGSVTQLGDGRVSSEPALWTASGPDGPWHLTRLPADDPLAEAHAVRCAGEDCVVVGVDESLLSIWDVRGTEVERATVPAKPVPRDQAVPVPVTLRGEEFVAVGSSLLQRTPSGWVDRTGPGGTPSAAATAGDTLYVITVEGDGRSRLWSAQP